MTGVSWFGWWNGRLSAAGLAVVRISTALIFSTRRSWRPPSKSVERKRSTIFTASSGLGCALAEREHVRVVVTAAHLGLVGVVRVDRADAVDLVGDDRDADAAAADEHSAIGTAGGDLTGGRFGEIGVVDGLLGVRAEVLHIVSHALQGIGDLLLQSEARVVGCDRDLHRFTVAIRWAAEGGPLAGLGQLFERFRGLDLGVRVGR